jgi:hypothetical protein
MAKLIQVIEAETLRGTGVDADPFREVYQLWTLEGELIHEYDSWLERPKVEAREDAINEGRKTE